MKWLVILTMVVLAFAAPADVLLIDEQETAGGQSVGHQVIEATSIVWHRCPKSADDAKPIGAHCSSDNGILPIGSVQPPDVRATILSLSADALRIGPSLPPLIRPPNPLA